MFGCLDVPMSDNLSVQMSTTYQQLLQKLIGDLRVVDANRFLFLLIFSGFLVFREHHNFSGPMQGRLVFRLKMAQK